MTGPVLRSSRVAAASARPRRWTGWRRFTDLLHDHAQVVADLHAPTVSLTCQACDQAWPCPPYAAAAGGHPAAHPADPSRKDTR